MATSQSRFSIKTDLLQVIHSLPTKDVKLIKKKIDLLVQDPTPDGKTKIALKQDSKLCRLRIGDYRILYMYDKLGVNVLTIRRRNEDTYKDCPAAEEELTSDEWEELSGLIDLPARAPSSWSRQQREGATLQNQDLQDQQIPPAGSVMSTCGDAPAGKRFPEPITPELLQQLQIPRVYYARLQQLTTDEELWTCPGLDDDTILKLNHYMFETPLQQIMQQPDLIVNDVEDLLRYKEGELLTFLLKLSPEQERCANWPLHASGPMLVKGHPGTGKSTVALYRIRSLLQRLLADRQSRPALLFTTYTRALVKSSEQLLDQLLGPDAQYVRVQTTDDIIINMLHECKQYQEIISSGELADLTHQAVMETSFAGNMLECLAQRQTIARIGEAYLLAEFKTVIIARQISNLQEYRAAPRHGRKLPLNLTQRTAVWSVYEHWKTLVAQSGKETLQQQRARAERLAEQSRYYHFYDAVVIDEAQDLDPAVLRLLLKFCKGSNRIFVTADANQSIYGGGFSWADVHQDLKFQGRTNILRANYRSTCEIGEAANSYLTSASLEPEVSERRYINNGPMPAVRAVQSREREVQLLARYFKKACSDQRLTLSSCALLCPGEESGRALVAGLEGLQIKASFMTSRDLDLKKSGVKVLPLKAAKGLEFPIVALAGFLGTCYPDIAEEASQEERDEQLACERRAIYVGMTRAMRTLLIVVPTNTSNPLLTGFDPGYWNIQV